MGNKNEQDSNNETPRSLRPNYEFYTGGLDIQEASQKSFFTAWVHAAASAGPVGFVTVSGIIAAAVIAMCSASSAAPYLTVAFATITGNVALLIERRPRRRKK